MSSTFVFLNNLFSQNEGRIFFQLILVLLISANLITIHSNRKLISQTTYRRAISSVLLILGLELLFLLGLNLNFLGVLPFETFLISYFQFIFSFSALWIIWLWCFPLASMKSDSPKFVFGMALTLIFLIQLFFDYVFRIINIEIATFTNIIWFLTTLVILVFGFVLLIINHHFNWFFGCIFTLIYLAGLLATQFFPGITQSQNNAILLFSQIIAFTFLPVLSQSFVYTALTEEKQVINNLPIASKKMPILPAQNVFKSWLSLAIKNQDILIANEFFKCLALTFHADLALLLAPSNQQDDLNITSGFSNKKSTLVFPLPIDRDCNRFFEGYIKDDKPFYLSTEDYFPNDLKYFLNLINVPQPVNILFFPIKLSIQSNNTFGILLFSSLLRWDKNHLDYLRSVKDEMVLILQKIFPVNVTTKQQSNNSLSFIDTEKKSIYSKIGPDETNDIKILRLESELKLALEEYARVQKLLEEKNSKVKYG